MWGDCIKRSIKTATLKGSAVPFSFHPDLNFEKINWWTLPGHTLRPSREESRAQRVIAHIGKQSSGAVSKTVQTLLRNFCWHQTSLQSKNYDVREGCAWRPIPVLGHHHRHTAQDRGSCRLHQLGYTVHGSVTRVSRLCTETVLTHDQQLATLRADADAATASSHRSWPCVAVALHCV